MTHRVWNVCPEESPSKVGGPSLRLTQLALGGYPQLAADSLLARENHVEILSTIEASIRGLDKSFKENDLIIQERCVSLLLEIALNFMGMERKRAGFSDADSAQTIDKIANALKIWESAGGSEAMHRVSEQMLTAMKMVLSGKGMVAKMAEEIETALVKGDIANSFIEASKKIIQGNVYYQIVGKGLSKFGNDSATGLRWARHLGAVQVSSNPVIAARAYEEIANLWKSFETVAAAHPEWRNDPEKFADEIALLGTVNSLLPNILDFRPIALLSDFKDGMVSIQLNPQKASSVEESIKDAQAFYSILKEILESYDAYLVPGSRSQQNARPNIVFKVSTSGVGAIGLTEGLDKRGIGTNNTVTFTVSQEVQMTLVAMHGLAAALKSGLPITTVYMTNMEGRLEDHLREVQAAKFLRIVLEEADNKDAWLTSTSRKVGAQDLLSKSQMPKEQQVNTLASKKFLKSLVDEWFVEVVGREKLSQLKQMEDDIRLSGIYVTRRVFRLLFDPVVKLKLVKYIAEYDHLSEADATRVVEAVDLLPASKRRADDTYLVLANGQVTSLTNTEFPDHQLKVLQKSREPGFRLSAFENSIAADPDPSVLKRLLEIPDFRKAYELTGPLAAELDKIGIRTPNESGGLAPEEWVSFGPVRKTMEEFTYAYTSFRGELVSSVAKLPSMELQEKITAPPMAK
jgi:hypothetical protein